MILANSKFHFVGVGGIGMSGLAELLHNMGATISGSDLSENDQVQKLKNLGVEIHQGHNKDFLGDVDVVVYSSAIPPSNPELLEAKAKKIPLISRAEVLGEIMRLKRGLAIAGCHGKTTTTSLVASIFLHAKKDPTVVVGGRLDLIKSNAFLGKGEWLIAEADESDGSFKRLSPEVSIITNIDSDHLDYYKNFENIQKAFYEFAHLVPFYGCCIVFGDDIQNRKLFENFEKRILFYGFHESNDFYLKKETEKYAIYQNSEKLGEFSLSIPGSHNALNGLAAFIAGLQCGLEPHLCIEGLESFKGVDRRFQKIGTRNGVEVYDDYGHHPTEIRAVLKAFREKYSERRIVVAFQPHRYTRTRDCWKDFLKAFEDCDKIYLTDIYAASESPIEGIHSQRLAQEIGGNCEYIGATTNLQVKLKELRSGDIFVTLGAGDIYKQGKKYLES